MNYIALALSLSYGVFYLYLGWQLRKKPSHVPMGTPATWPAFSVCIAFRNEAENLPALLGALAKLDYPSDKVELLLVNDASTDAYQEIIAGVRLPFSVRLIHSGGIGKKAALERAVQEAKHDYLLFSDADCTFPETWLRAFALEIEATSAVFLFGPVFVRSANSLLAKFEGLDLAALSATGLALGKLQVPVLCNGANLCCAKEAFHQVGGYSSHADLASGDDVFLYQKLAQAFPGRCLPLVSEEAAVGTRATESWSSFFQQRIRWANKWNKGQGGSVPLFALFVFLVNGCALLAMGQLLTGFGLWGKGWSLAVLALKFISDFAFLSCALRRTNSPIAWCNILWAVWLYPVYALLFGILANTKKTYLWKGRTTH